MLLEAPGRGRSEGFAPVALAGAPGEIRRVRIAAVAEGRLRAASTAGVLAA